MWKGYFVKIKKKNCLLLPTSCDNHLSILHNKQNGFVRRNIRFFLESSCIPPGVAAPWLWWWRARGSWGCGWMAAKALPAGSPGLTPTPTPRCRAPCCVACAGSSMLIIARHPSSNPLLPPPSSISDNTSPSWTRRPFNSSSPSEKK